MKPRLVAIGLMTAALAAAVQAQEPQAIEGWGRAVDPDRNCRFVLKEGVLTIIAPGPAHDLSAELGRMNAPAVLTEAQGDFVAQVRVGGIFEPGAAGVAGRTPYNGAGLLLFADDRNYVRLERATLVRNRRPFAYANFEVRRDGRLEQLGNTSERPLVEGRPTWLRLERRGDTLHGAVSQEEGRWHSLGVRRLPLPNRVRIGVAAVNASLRPFAPQFEKFTIGPTQR